MVGGVGHRPADALVRHVGRLSGREPSVRRVVCRHDEAVAEHAALRRLLNLHGCDSHPRTTRRTAQRLVERSLNRAPLVLAVDDAQWCDEGTIRWIDGLMHGSAGSPLTVLLSLTDDIPAVSAPAFEALVARDTCTVAGGPPLWRPGVRGKAPAPPGAGTASAPPGAARPPGAPAPETAWSPGSQENRLLRIVRAAVLLRSSDPDLVSQLAGLPRQMTDRLLGTALDRGLLARLDPVRGAPAELDRLMASLPLAEREQLRAQAAEILNDAGHPARQVAELLLGLRTLDRPWMRTLLREAAVAAFREQPATAVSFLRRLHEAVPDDLTVRAELAAALTDIDPAGALRHLDEVLARCDDPEVRAFASGARKLTALMTHRLPDRPEALGALLRELPHPASSLSCGGPADDLALSARALRTALTGTDIGAAVADAQRVLRTDRPRAAWATVAASRVLALSDDTGSALAHLDRVAAYTLRREEDWALGHAGANRALLLLESGRTDEAAEAALAATRLAQAQGGVAGNPLASIALALTSVARADITGAEAALRRLDGLDLGDSVWEHHLRLTARAFVERALGRPAEALRLLEACGAGLDAAGIGNPLFTTWWLHSAELHMSLGLPGPARERAEHGRRLAERWPTARSTGLSLLALGTVATGTDRVDLLTESVRVLRDSCDQHARVLAEIRLGKALLRRGDDKAARGRLHAARGTAVRCGMTAVAGQARAALAAAGGRPASVTLTKAERPVAEMAVAGASNRSIADTLCLTVRTVEYHLTSVYRKLGVTGRAGLAQRLAASTGHGSSPPGEER